MGPEAGGTEARGCCCETSVPNALSPCVITLSMKFEVENFEFPATAFVTLLPPVPARSLPKEGLGPLLLSPITSGLTDEESPAAGLCPPTLPTLFPPTRLDFPPLLRFPPKPCFITDSDSFSGDESDDPLSAGIVYLQFNM
ncbi:Protein of unknown function [Gryllus bimaculatus]|nr:Protein of unknown function [Gryllus bimaculatus]